MAFEGRQIANLRSNVAHDSSEPYSRGRDPTTDVRDLSVKRAVADAVNRRLRERRCAIEAADPLMKVRALLTHR